MLADRRFNSLLMGVLWLAVGFSAIVAVYARHESRLLFSELQKQEARRDLLNIDWGRLQLEQSTWGTHARIERIAREELGMVVPSPQQLLVVKP
ncbi:MAG: cell division protein FtsL [Gammaproteobacteria bacterium]|nr:cell division protein FtsL [Gammaproteobacteria bacterium]